MIHLAQLGIEAEDILNHTHDGIYVVDPTCRILFWNRTAEIITGWTERDVVGRRCSDDILVHVDKAGRELCRPGRCPLHRCMASGIAQRTPQLVFARKKDGSRVPVSVAVTPLMDKDGRLVGGVEVFSDQTENLTALAQARRVQENSLPARLPRGSISFHALYRPMEEIGGDYYRVETLPDGTHAFLMADVAGHGMAAALYTMTLRVLWQENAGFLGIPAEFMARMNESLERLTVGDSFATAFQGVVDPVTRRLMYASAGHPPAFLRRADGGISNLMAIDPALGMLPGMQFGQETVQLHQGDLVFLFSDGALEATDPQGRQFGEYPLMELVRNADPGDPQGFLRTVYEALLDHVQDVTLADDLTLLAVTCSAN